MLFGQTVVSTKGRILVSAFMYSFIGMSQPPCHVRLVLLVVNLEVYLHGTRLQLTAGTLLVSVLFQMQVFMSPFIGKVINDVVCMDVVVLDDKVTCPLT